MLIIQIVYITEKEVILQLASCIHFITEGCTVGIN